MESPTSSKAPDQWAAYNYCISFIDLLGQRNALKGEGLLPVFKTEEDHQRFLGTLKESIGAILKLQERAETMLREGQQHSAESPFRLSLSPENQALWDEMLRTRVTSQRWSDGLVSFVCLGDQDIKCPLNGIFNIFGSAGSLCLMGLAYHHPLRGAIDIAWGIEIRPGELYGAAVAQAYELESIYAQYPRIVVSSRTIAFLEAHKNSTEQDIYSACNRSLAELCLSMLAQDVDGIWILHYLGDQFREAITTQHHPELYSQALQFIEEQLHTHQKSGNSKLAFRYSHLLLYFETHRPNT